MSRKHTEAGLSINPTENLKEAIQDKSWWTDGQPETQALIDSGEERGQKRWAKSNWNIYFVKGYIEVALNWRRKGDLNYL